MNNNPDPTTELGKLQKKVEDLETQVECLRRELTNLTKPGGVIDTSYSAANSAKSGLNSLSNHVQIRSDTEEGAANCVAINGNLVVSGYTRLEGNLKVKGEFSKGEE